MSLAAYCENGHLVGHEYSPRTGGQWRHQMERRSKNGGRLFPKFCNACGKRSYERCPACTHPISYGSKYCGDCGTELPWTSAALAAATAAADEADLLSADEKSSLKETFADLARESPRTPLALNRFEKLTAKAGPVISSIIKDVISPILLAEAKKKLGL